LASGQDGPAAMSLKLDDMAYVGLVEQVSVLIAVLNNPRPVLGVDPPETSVAFGVPSPDLPVDPSFTADDTCFYQLRCARSPVLPLMIMRMRRPQADA
jgi:hypothetical protein